MSVFDNKSEAVRYYNNQLAKKPYLIMLEEKTLHGIHYKDRLLNDYSSPEHEKFKKSFRTGKW